MRRHSHWPITICSATLLTLPAYVTGQPAGLFGQAVTYPVGSNPTYVRAADLNGDGRPDLVVSNSGNGGTGSLSILFGNGDCTLQPRVDYRAENGVFAPAIGDLTEDGNPDVLTANYLANSVSIFRGLRNGRLVGRVDLWAGRQPAEVAIADLNGDGHADFAVNNFAANTVSVFLAKGHGRFMDPVDYPTRDGPFALAVLDLNLDGVMDIVVGNLYVDWSVNGSPLSVMLGRGDGTFGSRRDIPVGKYAGVVLSGDFSADGKPDLAVVNAESRSVSILLGDGAGGFPFRTDYATGDLPLGGTVGDLNKDGVLDLAVTNLQSNTVSVFLGNGDGTFGQRTDYPAGGGYFIDPGGIAIVDLNGDGWPDLAIANSVSNTVSVLLNRGAQAQTAASRAGHSGSTSGRTPWRVSFAVRQNPARIGEGVELIYTVPDGGADVEVSIYSVTGKEVARFPRRHEPGGSHVASWGGIDSRGEKVSSGIYLVRGSIGDTAVRSRVVLIR